MLKTVIVENVPFYIDFAKKPDYNTYDILKLIFRRNSLKPIWVADWLGLNRAAFARSLKEGKTDLSTLVHVCDKYSKDAVDVADLLEIRYKGELDDLPTFERVNPDVN